MGGENNAAYGTPADSFTFLTPVVLRPRLFRLRLSADERAANAIRTEIYAHNR
jgi:hypothetical protein